MVDLLGLRAHKSSSSLQGAGMGIWGPLAWESLGSGALPGTWSPRSLSPEALLQNSAPHGGTTPGAEAENSASLATF